MKLNRYIGLIIFLTILANCLTAQNKSNRGKEFWLGYSFSSNFFAHAGLSDPVNQQDLTLYISTSQQAATVTVSINGTAWTQTVSIPANTADATIIIPKAGVDDARILSDGLSTKAIHIVSDVPIAAYAHQYDAMYSAATMLMPSETWGFLYFSVNYYQTQGQSNPPFTQSNQGVNFPDWYNWFYVVAKDDNTRILITPSDSCKNGWLPGQTYTVNLNKGEIYTVFGKANFAAGWFSDTSNSSKDLTGSKILSVAGADGVCHPVALFSGSGGMHVCQNEGGEAVQQQMFPAQAWGTHYLTHHTLSDFSGNINNTFRNYYRVCVKDPTTIVTRNGVPLTGLKRNFFYEFMDSTGGDDIVADKPILVSQYIPNRNQCWQRYQPNQVAIGDPEMFYLSPVEQGQNNVIFYSSSFNLISKSYINIIIPTSAVASLLVDGAPVLPTKIKIHPNNPAYSVAIPDISSSMDMQHTITSDSAFTATVYGLGAYESYGYNIGCNINNLELLNDIKNVFSTQQIDTFTCPRTSFRAYAKAAYRLTNIHWHLSQVPGLFPNVDSIINNPIPIDSPIINGRKYYRYTLQQDLSFINPSASGTFNLPVSYTAPTIDACNQTLTENLSILVKPGPAANFSFTAPVCLKDSVYFTGTSIANGFTINNYLWNFLDATTANTVNTVKKFTIAGSQNVKYTIFTTNGCMRDTTKLITINPTPTANFGATTPICSSDSVRVTDTSSITSGNISSYQYYWGDGLITSTNTPIPLTHKYANAGTYIIKQIVTSNNSCISDTAYRTVVVNASPKSVFGFDKNICLGDSIRFTDTSTISSGSIINYKWDLGDGTVFNQTIPTSFYHPYAAAGSYIVTLTTTSNIGCLDSVKKVVNVSVKPTATFTISGRGCVDSPFVFVSSIITNPTATWRWNFGDGGTLNSTTSSIANHIYTLPQNNIIVKHVVDLGQGCVSDTASLPIIAIRSNPIASFSIIKDTLCENKPVRFQSSLPNINQWNWSFGNGVGNDVPPFTHTYTNVGSYNISLTVKDNVGCGSLPVTDIITVSPMPVINAGTDKAILQGTSVLLDASITPAASYNYLWTPSASLNASNILQPTATPTTTTLYVVQASNSFSKCTTIDTVQVQVYTKLYIPNSFTPNGDGLNDKWTIPAIGLYPQAVVAIYNRYGQQIFEQKNYTSTNAWDGTYKGVKQPTGAYVYLIKNVDGKTVQGTVMIFR